MGKKFSVLMANYNKGNHITEAINSVFNQTNKDWELIIADDASSDDSIEKIKQFKSDKINLIRNSENQGKIKVLEQIMALAQGEIIVELDSDDAIAGNTLELLSKEYARRPDAGLIYTQCYYCDENLAPKHLGFSAEIPKGQSNLHSNSVVALRSYKKKCFKKTAGFIDSPLYAEDIDIVLKLEEVCNLHFLDQPLYYYRILPKSQTHSFRNTRINRSSTALAKLNAYKRRLGTDIPNLSKAEISEVLFWGIINAFLALRWKLVLQLKLELLLIHPLFFLDYRFYRAVIKKIKKLKKLKQEKTLLKI